MELRTMTPGRVLLFAAMLLVLLQPFCQAAPQEKDIDWWAPLSFEGYLQQQSQKAKSSVIYAADNDSTCRRSAEEWASLISSIIDLSKSQASQLQDFYYQRERIKQPYFLTQKKYGERLEHPLAYAHYDEDNYKTLLRDYFDIGSDVAMLDAKFWRNFKSVVNPSETKTKDFLLEHTLTASDSLRATNGRYSPGLWRLEERFKYAQYLSPNSAEDLQNIYDAAKREINPLMSQLFALIKKMDAIENSENVDETALREIAREGLDTQIQVGLLDFKAEWKMLELIPDNYQGTWAQLPPGTHLPDKKQ